MKSENEEVSGRNKIPNGRWREQPIFKLQLSLPDTVTPCTRNKIQ